MIMMITCRGMVFLIPAVSSILRICVVSARSPYDEGSDDNNNCDDNDDDDDDDTTTTST